MADTKIISFAGIDHPDIVYFLAKLLSTNARTVLVLDNSEKHNLYRDIHAGKKGEDFVIEGRTCYTFDTALSDVFGKFDYVIVYHGMKPDNELWDASEKRYLMVNSDANDIQDIKEGLRRTDTNLTLDVVFCDLLYGKVTEDTIINIIGIAGRESEDIFMLPFDPDNIEVLQMFEFNGKHSVKDTTQGMQKLLEALYASATNSKPKSRDFKKLVKAAG